MLAAKTEQEMEMIELKVMLSILVLLVALFIAFGLFFIVGKKSKAVMRQIEQNKLKISQGKMEISQVQD